MNVEKISALEQIKAMLSRAYNTAERQLRDPFGDKESVSSYLLSKIYIVTTEIDAFISEEENTFLKHYSEENHEVEVFPLDYDIQVSADGSRFNPLIHKCASEIAAAFGDCWVEVKAFMSNSPHPLPPLHLVERGEGAGGWGVRSEYSISIQPDEYTPNDIQLKLKSLGYTPIFKKFLPASRWVYFDVSYKGRKCALSSTNGIAFELSSTVSSKEPPEFERYSEPATDELPF